mmetsp:Transcript_43993/g.79064  ORF Transcript_43993/g.79064 Transcript_43993/m.79064 type:complete len:403 (-) Transcript_43993:835-2043(-)
MGSFVGRMREGLLFWIGVRKGPASEWTNSFTDNGEFSERCPSEDPQASPEILGMWRCECGSTRVGLTTRPSRSTIGDFRPFRPVSTARTVRESDTWPGSGVGLTQPGVCEDPSELRSYQGWMQPWPETSISSVPVVSPRGPFHEAFSEVFNEALCGAFKRALVGEAWPNCLTVGDTSASLMLLVWVGLAKLAKPLAMRKLCVEELSVDVVTAGPAVGSKVLGLLRTGGSWNCCSGRSGGIGAVGLSPDDRCGLCHRARGAASELLIRRGDIPRSRSTVACCNVLGAEALFDRPIQLTPSSDKAEVGMEPSCALCTGDRSVSCRSVAGFNIGPLLCKDASGGPILYSTGPAQCWAGVVDGGEDMLEGQRTWLPILGRRVACLVWAPLLGGRGTSRKVVGRGCP